MIRYSILAALAVLISACSSQTYQSVSVALERKPQAETERTVTQGKLIGTYGAEKSLAWYGIPYAAPPIGNLRWRAPRAPSSWQARYEATWPDRHCPQFPNEWNFPDEVKRLVGDEDCLYLNIWAPSKPSTKPLPVMFWIHGGASVSGHAGLYEMGRLANAANVVVVSVNYRLAMLGWLAHPALVETAESELDRASNFALLDLIAALKWVQDNVAVFGGDADNVTVFGQSAGAFHITALLSSPLTKGLFHKAIVQSGGINSASRDEALYGTNNMKGHGASDFIHALQERKLLSQPESLSSKSLADALRAVPLDTMFEIYDSLPVADGRPDGMNPISTSNDGVTVPMLGVRQALTNEGKVHDIPLMIGTNRDEITGMSFLDPEMVDSFLGLIFWPKDADAWQAHAWYPNTAWAYYGVEEIAERWTATRQSPVFTYRFDWDEQGSTFGTDIGTMVGAAHTLEVPFLIKGFDHKPLDPLGLNFNKHNRQSREALSAKLIEYWAAFAHSGSPGKGLSQSLPEWTPWSADRPGRNRILLDSESDGGIRMAASAPPPDQLFSAFLADDRFKTLRARCKSVKLVLHAHNIVGGESAGLWEDYFKDKCLDGVLD